MAANHVIINGVTRIDLRSDTVASDSMLSGVTAHNKAGESITGSLVLKTYYSGTTTPSSSLGNDGDIYLKVVS